MRNKKIALITGISGQDGSFLSELLLKKGYEVHGIIRRSSSFNTSKIDHIFDKLELNYGDLTDSTSIDTIIQKIKPDEIYHLGAQSHVKVSFDIPKYTSDVNSFGTLYLLESMKKHVPNAKFYNASSSELFGKVQETPQNENTPFYPISPYGVSKIHSYWMTKTYRQSYNLFATNGILFNHESERRGGTFVTKKVISKLIDMIVYHGNVEPLLIGNLEAKRDWGYTPEYVEGMWKMLQHSEPDDFVLATGETHSVRELIEEVCKQLNLNLEWYGKGKSEIGICTNLGISRKTIVKVNPIYFRPNEINSLLGDPSKAKKLLNWEAKIKFKELIEIMIKNEFNK